MKFREKAKRTVDAICLTFNAAFDDGAGNCVEACIGDWVVTEADGTQSIMDEAEFGETFEAVAQKGPRGPRSKSVEESNTDESAE